ncbi:glycosyltransferase family 4 protein [uncultured Lutibacter sp.]|uniref:glycosyltransferase family 4 protein n=1 Tax=uncultured Lutibacter sp. TaxID=437739 RepID=UPI002603369B|nr:glycosyltransferase family 4 protein [uncultured Lutibacter sp.]
MKSNYEVLAVSSSGEILMQVGKKEGVRVVPIEMSRAITPFKDVKAVWQLYKLFKKEQPLIVHTHTPKAGIAGMLAAKLAQVPIRLHTVAGMPLLETTGIKRTILNAVEKLTYGCATRVYPNSKGLESIIKKHKFTKTDKLKVLANGSSNGINTSHFDPQLFTSTQNDNLKNQLGISANDFVFIFVGRLVGDKGINELVAGFKELSDRSDKLSVKSDESSMDRQQATTKSLNFKLLLVGPLETELDPLKSETIKEIEENSNIISVGWQADVRPYFAVSNCLVFPSYREGFPNVVLQAGAMGLPSIVSNINGCNEIIEQGKNGWIIPVKDTEAIANAMEKSVSDVASFNEVKMHCRKMIQDRFEQKVVWEALLEEYQRLENWHFEK